MAPRRVSVVPQGFCGSYAVCYAASSFSPGKQEKQLHQLDSGEGRDSTVETAWFSGAEDRSLQTDSSETEERALQGRELRGSPILTSGISDILHHSGDIPFMYGNEETRNTSAFRDSFLLFHC